MTDLTIPDEAWAAAADAFETTAAKFAAEPWYTADVNDVMSDAAIASINAAAPLILAAELRRQADEMDAEAQRLLLSVQPEMRASDLGSAGGFGALSAHAKRLNARADALDPAGAK